MITTRSVRNRDGYGSTYLQYSDYLDELPDNTGQSTGQGGAQLGASDPADNGATKSLNAERHPKTGKEIRRRLTTKTERGPW